MFDLDVFDWICLALLAWGSMRLVNGIRFRSLFHFVTGGAPIALAVVLQGLQLNVRAAGLVLAGS